MFQLSKSHLTWNKSSQKSTINSHLWDFLYIVIFVYSYYVNRNTMSKRVTIMIDDDLDKKLRLLQAKLIQQNQTSYSYSKVLNESLRKVLK